MKKWQCIEIPSTAFGIEKGGVYDQVKFPSINLPDNEMMILNKRGNQQIVDKKFFKEL